MINVLWMYPDILNLHGERANAMAFEVIGKKLGLNVNKDSALKGLLLLFAPEIQNGGFSYNGVTDVGDQALQSNYFTI